MIIKQVAYWNHQFEWRFEPIQFSNLALLVGVSGVGKTHILLGIYNLRKIANGASFNGLAWDITFLANNGVEYRWKGEFETQESHELIFIEEEGDRSFQIISEELFKEAELIVQRKGEKIIFQGQDTPKLSPYESLVEIFKREEDVAPVRDSFNRIIYSAQCSSVEELYRIYDGVLTQKSFSSSDLNNLQQSDMPTQIKLAFVYHYFPKIFQKIKERFIEVFNQVEDIKLEPIFILESEVPIPISRALPSIPIQIKEKGVKKWIIQQNISSGMFKTLMHISELYLCPEGSVILIDEFENSFGVNCIDIITEDLVQENRNLQFIITSHHPYIINNIGLEYWKIVTRKGGAVTVKDAGDLNLGKSRHKAFMQLINSEVYTEGIAV
ncbi:MAG: AAA family ATPase [Cyanobacteriota bacterium]|nr:AAA family ATPase [Cyanobacteriota bacterium]